jgi:translation initiation factor 2 alpha subunit (eIF-2alpha)
METPMGRTPNYRFDRMQRDKAKAEKKAEKAAAKAKKTTDENPDDTSAKPETDSSPE